MNKTKAVKKSESKRPVKGLAFKRRAYRVCGHIWIEGADGAFLGLGRIMLLERIMSLGSIRRAAGSKRMSYRRAWELVESMNRQAAFPLVIASTGGRNGGGACLTEAGREAIAVFRRMDSEFGKFAQKEGDRLTGLKKV